MKKLIIILICLSFLKLFAQENFNFDQRDFMNFGKSFFYELHYLPTGNPDSINAIVLFKISYDLLSFKKLGISAKDDSFYSFPKIDIDFQDSESIIRNRVLWQDTIKVSEYEKTLSKTDFISGFVITNLKIDQYKVTLRFVSENVGSDKILEIQDTIPNDFYSKNVISNPIYVIKKADKNLYPCILNNNMIFTNDNAKIIIPVSFSDNINKFWYQLKFVKSDNEGLKWHSDFDKEDFVIPVKNQVITFKDIDGNIRLQSKSLPKINNLNQGYIEIDLLAESIVPGYYNLRISNLLNKDTSSFDFQIIWVDKPFILQKPRYAIESMYYILTDKEYEEMLDADYEDYSNRILNYWKKQDPTPETPYNESMSEYFRRVDYALFNFKTFSNRNGVKTDKGKIYILFGTPTSTEKKLKDEKSYEIWYYKHLDKQFIFESKANDEYKLVDIIEDVY